MTAPDTPSAGASTAAPPVDELPDLDEARAARLVAVALANVARERPYHLQHLLLEDADLGLPESQHPVFHGSYDWHSCVHMHWTLARCLRRFPQAGWAPPVRAHLAQGFTRYRVAGELRYLQARPAFERPYGWGWLLKLQAELFALATIEPAAAAWRDALAPLAQHVARAFTEFLPRADFPVRAGTHGNSAFALALALDYAEAVDARGNATDPALLQAIAARALRWFALDRAYPAAYEPSGDDFLSGGLCEALLMLRVLPPAQFGPWWDAFAPQPLAPWLTPVAVSDARDPKIVHLHGLNLSRAWCWNGLASHLPPEQRDAALRAAQAHRVASWGAAVEGDYVGTHWLASFALLAFDDAPHRA